MSEEKDINVAFDELIFAEERATEVGSVDGYSAGSREGEVDGYRSGYECGFGFGQELGSIYGHVVALQQSIDTTDLPVARRLIEKLIRGIQSFPQTNDITYDIVGKLEDIRSKYKHLCTILHHPSRIMKYFNTDDNSPIAQLTNLKKRETERKLSF